MMNKKTILYKAFTIDDLNFLIFEGSDKKIHEIMINSSEIKNLDYQIKDVKLSSNKIKNYLNGIVL
ncbi:MAG: hypothetical protein CL624_13245 [Arcobacter sp.]|nr:hypothetical protein [Arcobacter sp.]|tara:strand:- start:11206 stop:11403 length:198 start_codon:yes stop_codon:yes gene_type:complete